MTHEFVRLARLYKTECNIYHYVKIGFIEKGILVNHPKNFAGKKTALCLNDNKI